MIASICFHCGNNCDKTKISFDQKMFCCTGCKTVYEIFSAHDLSSYYELQSTPGAIPSTIEKKYDYLDNSSIQEKLIEFDDSKTQIVTLYIPHIHCSSCIWILENLHKLKSDISFSQVNFPKKTVRINYDASTLSLKEVVMLLSKIGYEPYISLDDYTVNKKKTNKDIIYKLGISGFAFGNVMFLSFPEYFEVSGYWIEQYKFTFRWLMFFFSLPVVLYAAQEYFISAYKGLRSKTLNIDVPIALGIFVLFTRSTIEILFDLGTGFFDSLTGLVFFLLLGKFFQQKTYSFLSFERDYKSYFPIAVTKIDFDKTTNKKTETSIQVYDIKKGDELLIRNEELIPVDSILINGHASIDYSFVTGESKAVGKQKGDKLFAGGKQTHGVIEIEATKSVEQSYLTQLWSNTAFRKNNTPSFVNLTDTISRYFTIAILSIAAIATSFWLLWDSSKAIEVFTAVLIIACPCALALSRPFALGNMIRIFGKYKFYLKNIDVIEQLSQIDTIIFDKTGTITQNKKSKVDYNGTQLTIEEEALLKNTLRGSNHPLSRTLYQILANNDIYTLDEYNEFAGKGIEAKFLNNTVKVGSAHFVGLTNKMNNLKTEVHISTNDIYKGHFVIRNQYRKGLKELLYKLSHSYNITILSGDNEGEKEYLQTILPQQTKMLFNQKPDDKLKFVASLQKNQNKNVMMIGDGLNDAGALAQSNVGIAVSENVNVFSPACDGILDATQFNTLNDFIKASKNAMRIIKASFIFSILYNLIGLYFAVTGQLSPIIAAILMPLSSISIVVFVTLLTNWSSKNLSNESR